MNERRVYWAGDLFDHKDLIGNLLLSEAFNRLGEGRWKAVLPQENEANAVRNTDIRDGDLKMVFEADALVANFDGADLDSGTVAEFCFAKFLDLPTVLLRTDFRDNNDRSTCPDPWNLMCSGYPRTIALCRPAIRELNEQRKCANSSSEAIRAYCENLAARILEALESQTACPSFSGAGLPDLRRQYRLALQSAGGSLPRQFPDSILNPLIEAKIQRGIYHD